MEKKAYCETHSLEERMAQCARCYNCGVPFCQANIELEGKQFGCPLHNLIPEWNDLLRKGNVRYALERLLRTNCFPEFTGRVCPAFCEQACTRKNVDGAVTVRENELYLIEYAFEHGWMQPSPPAVRSGKKIAVVGSGPVGLSAAYYLNRRGHEVTVFEKDDEPGGSLLGNALEKRLPKEIVRRRIALMEAEGVRFVSKTEISENTAAKLKEQFDLVLFCTGKERKRDARSFVCYAIASGKHTAAEADCALMGYTGIEE